MLQSLYECKDRPLHGVYISLIVLLMLSQDSSVCRLLQTLIVEPPPTWLSETVLARGSLSDVLIVTLCRLLYTNATTGARDTYIATTSFAIIGNLTNYVQSIHPYSAHRLVRLASFFSRRLLRLTKPAATANGPNSHDGPASTASASLTSSNAHLSPAANLDLATDINVTEDFVYLSLEIINR